jgi:succinyl-diaminopimelate desuccinylase
MKIINKCLSIILKFYSIFFISSNFAKQPDYSSLEKNLEKLIAFKTISSNQQENKAAIDWIKQELKGLPVYIHEYQSNGFSSLVVTTQSHKSPKLWLIAHMDVVSGNDSLFQLKRQNGIFIGRGVLDMKFAIACYIQLFKDLGLNLKNYDIGIMITSDEEIGGANGVKYLLNDQGYTGSFGLLPDAGFNWEIEQDAKGLMWVQITVEGLSSHASRPWLGINAINHLIAVLNDINLYFEQEKKKFKDYYSTVNLSVIQGGKTINQVPDSAQATLDIRYTSEFDIEQFKKFLNERLSQEKKANFEILKDAHPNHIEVDIPEIKLFKKYAKEIYQIDIGTTRSHGASDARFFSDKNIPILLITPKGSNAHSQNESLNLDDFHRYYNLISIWAKEISRIKED